MQDRDFAKTLFRDRKLLLSTGLRDGALGTPTVYRFIWCFPGCVGARTSGGTHVPLASACDTPPPPQQGPSLRDVTARSEKRSAETQPRYKGSTPGFGCGFGAVQRHLDSHHPRFATRVTPPQKASPTSRVCAGRVVETSQRTQPVRSSRLAHHPGAAPEGTPQSPDAERGFPTFAEASAATGAVTAVTPGRPPLATRPGQDGSKPIMPRR